MYFKLLEISICDIIPQPSYVEGSDSLVFWWIQSWHCRSPFQQFVCHWVINTIVTVLNVLVGQRVIGICGFFVPEKQNKKIL